MSSYLHHITLSTGHSRRSYRSEVDDDVIPHIQALILRARDQRGAALDGPAAHCSLTVAADAGALMATISAPLGPHLPGVPVKGPTTPLVTIGVPRKSKAAPRLWDILVSRAGSVAAVRPPAPWCAVWTHDAALSRFPDTVEWLGDLERLIAWAWLEWQDL